MIERLAEMPRYEVYKDSGVEWLGEIPRPWTVKRIKYLLDEVNDRSETGQEELLSLSKYKGVIRKSSLEEKAGQATSLIGYKKVAKGQLVINKMQAVNGLLAVSSLNGITSPDYSVYQEKSNALVNIYYLNYLLSQSELLSEFKKRVTGVMEGFIRLYTDDLYDIKAIMPPFSDQNIIVGFLDRKTTQIDQAVAIKEQQIALLKEHKQILIQNAVTRGLDPNAPMRDSGVEWIGEIPEHWSIRKLKYIVRFVSGSTPSKERAEYWNGTIPWVSPKDMKRLNIDSSIDYITDVAIKNTNIRLLDVGTILIVVRGMILAKKVPVALSKSFLTINQDMKGLIPSADCMPEFLLYLLDGINGVLSTLLEESGHGTKTLPTEKLGQLPLGIPPKEEQALIITHIESQSAKIDQAIAIQQQQIDKLKEYKATLINSAVTGKIRVPEAAA